MPFRKSLISALAAVSLLLLSCSSDETPSGSLEVTSFGLAPELGAAVADPSPSTPTVRKVLFIAVDGLRASKIDNTDGGQLAIPSFERMQRDGIFVLESHQERVSGGKYRTCPGFIQMTTGKRIAAHGVKDNPDCREGRFDEFPIFFKRLKELRPDIRIGFADPTDQVLEITAKSCGFDLSCIDAFERFDDDTFEGDLTGRDKVLEWLEDGRFDLLWYHPHEVDDEGHESGWDDDPINDVVERLDAEIIGPLLDAVATRERTSRERWMVIATSDHGGHDTWWGLKGNHDVESADMKVPIIISGTLIPDEGNQGLNAFNTWDLPATVYDYLGLTPSASWPATDGTSVLP